MRSKRLGLVMSGVLLAAAIGNPANAQTVEAQCPARYLVQGGVGTARYDESMRDNVHLYSWDDLFKIRYPRVVRSSNDLPEKIAPKARIGGLETTLFAIEGSVSCGSVGGRGGAMNLVLSEPPGGKGRTIDFGYPGLSCEYASPNFARLKDLDRKMEPWIGSSATSGCGYIGHFVRLIGYGYWETTSDINVKVSMYPVLDIIVLDTPGGTELSPTLAPDPAENKNIDLTVSANVGGVRTSYRVSEADGTWWANPVLYDYNGPSATNVRIENSGDNPANKNSGPFGWFFNFSPPLTSFSEFGRVAPGTYTIDDSQSTTTARFGFAGGYPIASCCESGRITISDIEWDCLPEPAYHGLHLVRFDATFTGQSPTFKTSVSGHLSYSAPPQVPCPSSTPTPTPSPSPNPNPNPNPNPEPTPSPTPNPTPSPSPSPGSPSVVLPESVTNNVLLLGNSASSNVSFSVIGSASSTSDLTITATSDDPQAVNVTVTPSTMPAGGGDATVTIKTSAAAIPRDYRVTITATSGEQSGSASFVVSLVCSPPMILGIDQPRGVAASAGDAVTLSVKPSGTGPFGYQWFTGTTGNDRFPVAGATSSSLTATATNGLTSYWVRVTNACGSADSATATINGRSR